MYYRKLNVLAILVLKNIYKLKSYLNNQIISILETILQKE